MHPKVVEIAKRNIKTNLPNVRVGDTVKITVKIKEGTKERSQNYEGVIIKTKGASLNKTLTVRKVFQGVGVERVFFLYSPKIEKIEILRSGKTRRAKLYYIRERTGKSTKLKEIIMSSQEVNELPKEEIPEEGKLVEVK